MTDDLVKLLPLFFLLISPAIRKYRARFSFFSRCDTSHEKIYCRFGADYKTIITLPLTLPFTRIRDVFLCGSLTRKNKTRCSSEAVARFDAPEKLIHEKNAPSKDRREGTNEGKKEEEKKEWKMKRPFL